MAQDGVLKAISLKISEILSFIVYNIGCAHSFIVQSKRADCRNGDYLKNSLGIKL